MRVSILVAFALTVAGTGAVGAEPAAWSAGAARPFVAGEVGAGFVAKAQLAVGWGRPHWQWVGVEALALSTIEFGAIYGGARARLPFLDATAGVRWTGSYVHPALPAQARHTTIDGDGAGDRGGSFDASLTLYGPAPRGYVMLWGDLVRPFGLAATAHRFEELERAVVGAGATVAVRGSYLAAGQGGRLLVGPMVEHVWLGGRDAGVWRAGVAGFRDLSPRWQVALVLTVVVDGPDDLGVLDGMWGTGLVRYRWATGR